MSKALARKLIRIRKELDWSQGKMAKMLNVSQAAVSIWENGHGEPKRATLQEIANLADIPMLHLIDEKQIHRPIEITMKVENRGEVSDAELGHVENLIGTTGKVGAIQVEDESMLPFQKGWVFIVNMEATEVSNDKIGTLCVVGQRGGHGRKLGVVTRGPTEEEVFVAPIGMGSVPYPTKPSYLYQVMGIRTV